MWLLLHWQCLYSFEALKKPLLADDNTSFVRAVVTQNDNEDLQAEASLDSGDSQKVVLLIKSGSHKGETVDAYSLNGYLYGANCKVGTRVIASLSEYDAVCQQMFITTTGK